MEWKWCWNGKILGQHQKGQTYLDINRATPMKKRSVHSCELNNRETSSNCSIHFPQILFIQLFVHFSYQFLLFTMKLRSFHVSGLREQSRFSYKKQLAIRHKRNQLIAIDFFIGVTKRAGCVSAYTLQRFTFNELNWNPTASHKNNNNWSAILTYASHLRWFFFSSC